MQEASLNGLRSKFLIIFRAHPIKFYSIREFYTRTVVRAIKINVDFMIRKITLEDNQWNSREIKIYLRKSFTRIINLLSNVLNIEIRIFITIALM